MDHPKHTMTPDIPQIDPTTDSAASPENVAPVYPTAGNGTPPDKKGSKRTHRGGKHNKKKSKDRTAANDQPNDGESKADDLPEDKVLTAIPEEEEGEVINTGKSDPTERSTGHQSTGQPTKGEAIRRERRWSAGDLDEREDCERIIKARRLVNKTWEAMDELARMIDEEEVLKRVDGRFICEE